MVDRKTWGGAIIAAAALVAGASALPSLLLQPEPIGVRFAPETLAAPPPAQRLPLAEPIISAPVNIAALAPAEPDSKAASRAPAFPPFQPVGIEEARALGAPAPATATPAKPAAEKQPAEKQASASTERGRRKAARGVRPAVFPIREFLAWRR